MEIESFEHIKMIEQPQELKIDLYPHQLASIYLMEKLEREKQISLIDEIYETDIGINADETGYGKSLSMVSLVLRDKMSWDLNEKHKYERIIGYADQHIRLKQVEKHNRINTTIVLASSSIIHQWEKEFKRTPLKILSITKRREANDIDVTKYDVVIVTPTMFNKLVIRYTNVVWKRFIYDEPGHLRVPAMKDVNAGFTWLITATPESIFHLHCRAQRSFMRRIAGNYSFTTIYPYITIKNSKEFILASFKMPKTHHIYHECYNPLYNTLNGIVNKRIKTMIEGGNISGAIEALGGQRTDDITKLVIKRKKEDLDYAEQRLELWTQRNNDNKKKDWTEKRNKISKQIEELKKRCKENLEGDCCICREELDKPVLEPLCQNIFCGKCLLTWYQQKGTCPLCRVKIKKENLIYLVGKDDCKIPKEEEKKLLSKEEKIVNLIKGHNKKVIIFSNFDETFNQIRNILIHKGITFAEAKGAVTTREKNLEKFRNGEVKVIFLNSKYNGAGINLQETTDIILYHSMNESTQHQIIGRANRIGRTQELNVHHLCLKK